MDEWMNEGIWVGWVDKKEERKEGRKEGRFFWGYSVSRFDRLGGKRGWSLVD